MSVPIYVDAYSGYKAHERPRQFASMRPNGRAEVPEKTRYRRSLEPKPHDFFDAAPEEQNVVLVNLATLTRL